MSALASLPEKDTPNWVRYGTYPVLLAFTVTVLGLDISLGQPGEHAAFITAINALVLLTLEGVYPFQRRWRMTWQTARKDLLFMVFNGSSLALANWALTWIALNFAPEGQLLKEWPVIGAAVAGLLLVQFIQYWLHRAQHELRGRAGKFLWRIHRPHHSLDRVYILMHARAHPLDGFFVRLALVLPLGWMGVSPEALYIITTIIGLQGFMSHLNVDIRVGWFNYLLTGTELHRFHHSAKVEEARNYGNITPVFDILFGTFSYRPGQAPEELGVSATEPGPKADQVLQQMLYPFKA